MKIKDDVNIKLADIKEEPIISKHIKSPTTTYEIVVDRINHRAEPNVDCAIIAVLKSGTKIEINEVKSDGKDIWGKYKDGWINLKYCKEI